MSTEEPITAGGPPPTTDKCPKCGSPISQGYGMAFGGMGAYWYCEPEECNWFYKIMDRD